MDIEQHLLQVQKNNAERVQAAIVLLGKKYLLHPANRVIRLNPKPTVLKGLK